MALPTLEQFTKLAEALGLGGVILEVVRRGLIRRKVRRTVASEAAAMTAKGRHSQADLQRALTAATETILEAHGRDFTALRKQLAAQQGQIDKQASELTACRESHAGCEAENLRLAERVAILEHGRTLAPHPTKSPSEA